MQQPHAESRVLRHDFFLSLVTGLIDESLSLLAVGEKFRPAGRKAARRVCRSSWVHASEPLGRESLRTLSQTIRRKGLGPLDVRQPRTELLEGPFNRNAAHLIKAPSRTAVSAPQHCAPSSLRRADPGMGERALWLATMRAAPVGLGLRHQLEDGVHYAEAPSSKICRSSWSKEHWAYATASVRS